MAKMAIWAGNGIISEEKLKACENWRGHQWWRWFGEKRRRRRADYGRIVAAKVVGWIDSSKTGTSGVGVVYNISVKIIANGISDGNVKPA